MNENHENYENSISLSELLPLQSKCVELEIGVNRLREAIAQHEEKSDLEKTTDRTPLAHLMEQKEDLLANVAIGEEVDQDQIENIEKLIAEAKTEYEKQADSISVATHTVAGLKRKLRELERKLDVARRNYQHGMVMYIDCETERAAAKYAELSGQLADKFMQIVSLASLNEKLGSEKVVFGPYTYQLKIPSFALDACRPEECKDMAGMLFRFDGVDINKYISKEQKRLHELGIKFPG